MVRFSYQIQFVTGLYKRPSFLARGELSGWLGNQAVSRKQWKFVIDF